MAFTLILNDDTIPFDAVLTENNVIQQCLYWIGFIVDAQRTAIMNDAFSSFHDISVLSEDDIKGLASDFNSRTVADRRIIFALKQTKFLKGLAHFIQGFYQISNIPSILGLNKEGFLAKLDTAIQRDVVRSTMICNSKIVAEAANPGKLDLENKWKQWEERFNNYLSVQLGTNGIPLSYIIRKNDDPDPDTPDLNFILKCTKCAPLSGEFYIADQKIVFHMIVNATTGCASADWIKSTLKYSDGRRSWKKLIYHFAGEGSASKALAKAEHLFETLYYKNERAMSFEKFLTKCQKMFNIYKKQGEPLSDEAKVQFLFKHVQHPDLEMPI